MCLQPHGSGLESEQARLLANIQIQKPGAVHICLSFKYLPASDLWRLTTILFSLITLDHVKANVVNR